MATADLLSTEVTACSTCDAKSLLIGISGVSRSGKGTLTANLCRALASRLRVTSICQDDFAKSSLVAKLAEHGVVPNKAQGWEHSESTDWAALREEVRRRQESRQWDLIIVEGFRVFYDTELSRQMKLRVWIDICRETCRARRHADPGNGKVTQETFEMALWPFHEEYRSMVLKDWQVWNVSGEQDSESIFADAVIRINSCFDPQEEAQLPATTCQVARVEIVEPWLSHIVDGNKSHEGRVYRNTWAKLAPGDVLDAYSERWSSVKLRVQELLRFDDFDQAFEALGERLLPEGADTPADALQIYRQWYSADVVRECGGVVAVGVQVLESRLCASNA